MRNMCHLIENKSAPTWVNDISYYKESVPQDFGQRFREIRNNNSHVDLRRVSGGTRLTLKEFIDQYHKFVFSLYDSARYSWSHKRENPYELDHIKEFNLSKKDS